MSIFNPHPDDKNDIWNYKKYLTHSLWRFQSIQKSKKAQLTDDGGRLVLKFKVNRDQISQYKENLYVSTSIDEHSRILLIGRGAHEEIFSSVLKKNPADIELQPAWVLIQSNSNKKIPLKSRDYEGKLPGLCDYLDYDVAEYDYENDRFTNKTINSLTLELNSGIEIELRTRLIVDTSFDFQAKIDSYVAIRSKKDETLINKLSLFNKVEEYFNFVFSTQYTNQIFKITDWEGRHNKNTEVYMLHPLKGQNTERKDGRYYNELLFTKNNLPITNSANAIANWVENYDLFNEIIETIKLLKTNKLSEELRFSLLINALEATHRKNFNKLKQDKTTFKIQRQRILDSIPLKEDKQLIAFHLNWANEINLIDRLKDINDIAAYYGLEPFTEDELVKIKNTRNYLVHKDKALKSKAFSNLELYYVNISIANFLKIIVLNLLDLDRDEIIDIVETSKQLNSFYRDAPINEKVSGLL